MILFEGWSFWIVLTNKTMEASHRSCGQICPIQLQQVGHRLFPSLAFGAKPGNLKSKYLALYTLRIIKTANFEDRDLKAIRSKSWRKAWHSKCSLALEPSRVRFCVSVQYTAPEIPGFQVGSTKEDRLELIRMMLNAWGQVLKHWKSQEWVLLYIWFPWQVRQKGRSPVSTHSAPAWRGHWNYHEQKPQG